MRRPLTKPRSGHCTTAQKSGVLRYFLLAFILVCAVLFALIQPRQASAAGDLEDILKAGKLRHLGIPYAKFVSPQGGDGLDVEMMKLFAAQLGVKYEFVASSWGTIIPDLIGKTIKPHGDEVEITGECPIRGDAIATGFTILPWREKVIAFSTPVFPSGVWLIARANVPMDPITPTNDIQKDIDAVKSKLRGKTILAMKDSCLDSELYQLEKTGAFIKQHPPGRDLDEMIPLVIAGQSDTTLMDVPVALVALEKWPGEIKVIGPVSPQQEMAVAFKTSSPNLRAAFDKFFERCKADGTYHRLVAKYYPTVFTYYPDFFVKVAH